MAPNLTGSGSGLFLADAEIVTTKHVAPTPKIAKVVQPQTATQPPERTYQWQIVWRNVFGFIYLHLGAAYGLYLGITTPIYLKTALFAYAYGFMGGMGITAGAHRLWAHKTYKANLALRVLLMVCNTIAFQNHVFEWVRDHRVHHKFTDTDADPHNSRRGFFFSHMGWLLVKKHSDVKTKGKLVDMSDLEDDKVLMFQKKYYMLLMPIFCFVVPTMIPIMLWNENAHAAWYVCVFRFVMSLNCTWLVNSAAHMWGTKPYDKNISPVQNYYVSVLAYGEGWHNYHHAFPWDYKTSEFSGYSFNFTTAFIDLFAKLGWAYDLKTVNTDMIEKRAKRTGDGTHASAHGKKSVSHQDSHHEHEGDIWGWDDKDMKDSDRDMVVYLNRKSE